MEPSAYTLHEESAYQNACLETRISVKFSVPGLVQDNHCQIRQSELLENISKGHKIHNSALEDLAQAIPTLRKLLTLGNNVMKKIANVTDMENTTKQLGKL